MNYTKDDFSKRHIGSNSKELQDILKSLGHSSLEAFTKALLPKDIYEKKVFDLPKALSEQEILEMAKKLGDQNQIFKNYIGMGYHPSFTPSVIARNVLENPSWYSSYTPYQPELAQGRLQALLNFQTLIKDLTAMEVANASLLDEGTAAAEGLFLLKSANEQKQNSKKFFVDQHVFPQTLEVLHTRAQALKWDMEVGDFKNFKGSQNYFASVIQYPNCLGSVEDIQGFIHQSHQSGALSLVISDPLSLLLLKAPGEMQADVVVGSSQRFGIPLFFGGPHAAYIATHKKFVRLMPGRLVGLSKDRHEKPALRLALQTREQHIKRERATSNICTAQALLATLSGFYACYHGPQGLKNIASKINDLTKKLYKVLEAFDWSILNSSFFDSITVELDCEKKAEQIQKLFWDNKINIARPSPLRLSWSLHELTKEEDILEIANILKTQNIVLASKQTSSPLDLKKPSFSKTLSRTSPYLQHPVFNSYHSETKMMRYIKHLETKELSLTNSMIPLGSCTMKLNASTQMLPVGWSCFKDLHPFAPKNQAQGFLKLIKDLEAYLCELTGFTKFSFQGNAGSQGEYAGLLAIKAYHQAQNQSDRNICLIPQSAHGTNPASAVMAGFKVLPLKCNQKGEIDADDFHEKLKTYSSKIAALMLTYPSTYGIFEKGVQDLCKKIHKEGALVYLDGANMNALLGLCKVASIGFDVCHLNLHKTFCIPHGGGGPGVGPIGVCKKLEPFLPSHWNTREGFFTLSSLKNTKVGAISSAPYGSAGILPISWAYILMMGYEGLKKSAQVAMANANYIAYKLEKHYKILFTDSKKQVAHECILDFRKFKNTKSISIDDVVKRLIDYGFHAPTMSWPVPGTLMVEPTESESKQELDYFCEALISIKKEMEQKDVSILKTAPHTLEDALSQTWPYSYSKQQAFYPVNWLKDRKFWPPVSRVENAYGDINLSCSCPSMDDFN